MRVVLTIVALTACITGALQSVAQTIQASEIERFGSWIVSVTSDTFTGKNACSIKYDSRMFDLSVGFGAYPGGSVRTKERLHSLHYKLDDGKAVYVRSYGDARGGLMHEDVRAWLKGKHVLFRMIYESGGEQMVYVDLAGLTAAAQRVTRAPCQPRG